MKQAEKEHCPKGHEYNKENTYQYGGSRHCRTCRREVVKEIVEQNKIDGIVFPSQTPEAKKRSSLKELGWTPELFELTRNAQDNRCAICNKILNLDKKQNGSRACADHEHTVPPKPRGVICTNCNAGIGQFQDNPSFLRKAAAYLEMYQNDNVSDNSDIVGKAGKGFYHV